MSNKAICPAQVKANLTKKSKYLKYTTAKLQQKLASKKLRLDLLSAKIEDLKSSISLIEERLTQSLESSSGAANEV